MLIYRLKNGSRKTDRGMKNFFSALLFHFQQLECRMSPSNKMNKNFKCEICEATFSYDRSKNHHIKTIQSEGKTLKSKSFKCEICVDTFSSNCSKNRHIKHFMEKGLLINAMHAIKSLEERIL